MTHEEAVLANRLLDSRLAIWEGKKYEVDYCDEEGPLLIDPDSNGTIGFLVPWSEVSAA